MEEQCVKCEKWIKLEDMEINIPHTDIYFCKKCYFSIQPKRSKREDSIPEEAAKEFREFLDETFDKRMKIVDQLQTASKVKRCGAQLSCEPLNIIEGDK